MILLQGRKIGDFKDLLKTYSEGVKHLLLLHGSRTYISSKKTFAG